MQDVAKRTIGNIVDILHIIQTFIRENFLIFTIFHILLYVTPINI